MNDRVDVAWAADADGVHLGAGDLPAALARELLGPHRIIGCSGDNAEEALACGCLGADYVGIGPVFPTGSKADAGLLLGLDGLARAVRESRVPLIAIGGIAVDNLASVLETGVHGVAVLSAVCRSDDPAGTVAKLRAIIDRMHPSVTVAR